MLDATLAISPLRPEAKTNFYLNDSCISSPLKSAAYERRWVRRSWASDFDGGSRGTGRGGLDRRPELRSERDVAFYQPAQPAAHLAEGRAQILGLRNTG